MPGLYSSTPFAPPAERAASFVYANFICSLDGRISMPDERTAKHAVPRAIANRRDWRLFQELAAGADALLTTGRHVRGLRHGLTARSFPVSSAPEYADLLRWRVTLGLPPQPAVVIVTASLDLPPVTPLVEAGRIVYVATGDAADRRKVASLESQGARVLLCGRGPRVEGARLIEALAGESQRNIALIGGGEMLHALIVDGALDRLYLTLACRMVGGFAFDTLLTGLPLERTAQFNLKALHYDSAGADPTEVEQLFAVFDRSPGAATAAAVDPP